MCPPTLCPWDPELLIIFSAQSLQMHSSNLVLDVLGLCKFILTDAPAGTEGHFVVSLTISRALQQLIKSTLSASTVVNFCFSCSCSFVKATEKATLEFVQETEEEIFGFFLMFQI